MGLLESNGFLDAKAGHSDQRFCRWKLLFCQQPCAKAKEFGEAEFLDSMPVSALGTGVLISEFSAS